MLPAPALQDVLNHKTREDNALCCILMAPPFTKVGKEGVVPRLGYLNDRSGNRVHFYCAGYGGYWRRSDFPDMEDLGEVRYEDGCVIPWSFSQKVFASFVDELEGHTSWRYSGEADAILLGPDVDFGDCVVYDIETMVADGAIRRASELFEAIIQYSRSPGPAKSAYGLSDREGMKLFAAEAGTAVLSFLPKPAQALWKKGKHYAVKNIALTA